MVLILIFLQLSDTVSTMEKSEELLIQADLEIISIQK